MHGESTLNTMRTVKLSKITELTSGNNKSNFAILKASDN